MTEHYGIDAVTKFMVTPANLMTLRDPVREIWLRVERLELTVGETRFLAYGQRQLKSGGWSKQTTWESFDGWDLLPRELMAQVGEALLWHWLPGRSTRTDQ